MTTTLAYHFTKSDPVLRCLAQTLLSPSRPLPRGTASEPTEKSNPFHFIDESLLLLANLQKSQDEVVRREFEQQRKFIADKFEGEQYENGRRDHALDQRFTKIEEQFEHFGERFDEIDQRFDAMEQRFDRAEARAEKTEQRFDELRAMTFNSLSYRPHHQIHPVSVFLGNRLQMPDENYFPGSIKQFWRLHLQKKGKS
jgi:hypothetical protein